MAFCTNCGAQLDENSKFCTSCGTAVPQEEAKPFEQQEQVYGNRAEFNQTPVYTYQGADSNQSHGGYKANISSRSIATCIILSLVTCGLYGLYWYFCLINDLNTASGETDDAGPATVVLLSVITCGIYGWIWLYKAGKKVDKIHQLNGEPSNDTSILFIVLAVLQLSIVDYILIQMELNKVAANS